MSSSSKKEDDPLDALNDALQNVANAFGAMHKHLGELQQINESQNRFNDAFDPFLYGLSAVSSTIAWPEAPQSSSVDYIAKKSTTPATENNSNKPTTAPTDDSKQTSQRRLSAKSKLPSRRSSRPSITQQILNTGPRRTFVTKIDIRKIIDRLPLKFREQTEHTKNMEAVLKELKKQPEGINMPSMVSAVGLPKYRINDCLNAAIRSKDVVKESKPGQLTLYKFDPTKYPSARREAARASTRIPMRKH
ncbi:hypothetical protein BCR43DRAFT_488222 [Syncephalastrum racemosum]|uniref:Uncharacterized protein n=1 Tax=Syncephalastrum racemosum TaxID=13706 RepID=A0A1X2HID2_SYNRA|nr:hypothetical protein BCR43DRAFT_488222 [Syncephalastrum racemosum]